MKCRFFTAIVLAVAMLVSFGLCNLSVAADPTITAKFFEESGTVYDDNTHGPLGNYNNWAAGTDVPYTIAYYCETYPPSQLVGTSTYQTYYIEYIPDEDGDVVDQYYHSITNPISSVGGNGTQSIVDGFDSDSEYERLSNLYPGFLFHCLFTNKIKSVSGNAYFGERFGREAFYFITSGSRCIG